MQEPIQGNNMEPRWPVALAILSVILLLAALPGRLRLFPSWVPYVVGAIVLIPISGAAITRCTARWLQLERTITILFSVATVIGTLANMATMFGAMVRRPAELSGLQLFASSIGVWVTDVLAFSLMYWQIDRGGPGTRSDNAGPRPDWLFPQTGVPDDAPPNWRPSFVDYLFLGFSTATAFSPTDALPLTARAKMLMMLESTISLVTIVVVAARAINILSN